MRGLLYAESVGVEEAVEQLYRNEFDDDCLDFDCGVRDYIQYAKEKLITVQERNNDVPECP